MVSLSRGDLRNAHMVGGTERPIAHGGWVRYSSAMKWNSDFSTVPLNQLVLARLSEPIDLGSYGPDGVTTLLAEFYADGRFSYCGSPAIEDPKTYPLSGWMPIPA